MVRLKITEFYLHKLNNKRFKVKIDMVLLNLQHGLNSPCADISKPTQGCGQKLFILYLCLQNMILENYSSKRRNFNK